MRLLVGLLRHVGTENRELLQPLQAGQAVVQVQGAAAAAADAVVVVVVVDTVPFLSLSSCGYHLLLQLHRAFGPRVGTAQGQHGSLQHLSPLYHSSPVPPPAST